MRAIYKRELRSYFQSMTGCVFVAFLVIFTGIYFTAYNLNMGYPYFSYTLSGSLIVFLVGIPLITMKSFSEERKNKTDQLLLTAPVSLTKIVLGKYFAMVTVVAYSEPDFLSVSGDHSNERSRLFEIRLYFHSGLFPARMRVSCDRDVFVRADGKPDDRLYQYVRDPACFIFVGWNTGISAVFGERLYGRDHSPAEPGSPLYQEDDVKLVFERSFGSDRSDRKCGGVFYKIQCV